jgi:hypothetical protein
LLESGLVEVLSGQLRFSQDRATSGGVADAGSIDRDTHAKQLSDISLEVLERRHLFPLCVDWRCLRSALILESLPAEKTQTSRRSRGNNQSSPGDGRRTQSSLYGVFGRAHLSYPAYVFAQRSALLIKVPALHASHQSPPHSLNDSDDLDLFHRKTAIASQLTSPLFAAYQAPPNPPRTNTPIPTLVNILLCLSILLTYSFFPAPVLSLPLPPAAPAPPGPSIAGLSDVCGMFASGSISNEGRISFDLSNGVSSGIWGDPKV